MISQKLKEKIYLSIGEASTCWENLKQSGTFDSTRAQKISDELYLAIENEMDELVVQTRFDAIGQQQFQHLSVERVSPPKIVDAKFVNDVLSERFEKTIKAYILEGFTPHGSVSVSLIAEGHEFAILMVKYE